MKAIDVAKKLYPNLGKMDFIIYTCPQSLQITEGLCDKNKKYVDGQCEECWRQEVSDDKVAWLMECKEMCKLMGCD